ncbi:hypothetical protein [Azospirillum endophyticum]
MDSPIALDSWPAELTMIGLHPSWRCRTYGGSAFPRQVC